MVGKGENETHVLDTDQEGLFQDQKHKCWPHQKTEHKNRE